MAKQKVSRIKKAESLIQALAVEHQRLGHMLNLTMNTLNEYIKFNGDLKKFEKFIEKSKEEIEKDLEKGTE